jgi:hypothetical protein
MSDNPDPAFLAVVAGLALTDDVPGLRAYCLVVLGALRDSRAEGVFVQCLGDSHDTVVRSAIEGLRTLGKGQHVEKRPELLEHPELMVAWSAALVWCESRGMEPPPYPSLLPQEQYSKYRQQVLAPLVKRLLETSGRPVPQKKDTGR